MAAPLGLDPFTFARRFKLGTGMTPHQYVIRCRIRRAMRLLARGELTLAEIALEVGCACQSHLTTLFRKHLGTTPGAFRESASEGEQPAGRGQRRRAESTNYEKQAKRNIPQVQTR